MFDVGCSMFAFAPSQSPLPDPLNPHCYLKTKTNMFVVELKFQAAILRVCRVASISH